MKMYNDKGAEIEAMPYQEESLKKHGWSSEKPKAKEAPVQATKEAPKAQSATGTKK